MEKSYPFVVCPYNGIFFRRNVHHTICEECCGEVKDCENYDKWQYQQAKSQTSEKTIETKKTN